MRDEGYKNRHFFAQSCILQESCDLIPSDLRYTIFINRLASTISRPVSYNELDSPSLWTGDKSHDAGRMNPAWSPSIPILLSRYTP